MAAAFTFFAEDSSEPLLPWEKHVEVPPGAAGSTSPAFRLRLSGRPHPGALPSCSPSLTLGVGKQRKTHFSMQERAVKRGARKSARLLRRAQRRVEEKACDAAGQAAIAANRDAIFAARDVAAMRTAALVANALVEPADDASTTPPTSPPVPSSAAQSGALAADAAAAAALTAMSNAASAQQTIKYERFASKLRNAETKRRRKLASRFDSHARAKKCASRKRAAANDARELNASSGGFGRVSTSDARLRAGTSIGISDGALMEVELLEVDVLAAVLRREARVDALREALRELQRILHGIASLDATRSLALEHLRCSYHNELVMGVEMIAENNLDNDHAILEEVRKNVPTSRWAGGWSPSPEGGGFERPSFLSSELADLMITTLAPLIASAGKVQGNALLVRVTESRQRYEEQRDGSEGRGRNWHKAAMRALAIRDGFATLRHDLLISSCEVLECIAAWRSRISADVLESGRVLDDVTPIFTWRDEGSYALRMQRQVPLLLGEFGGVGEQQLLEREEEKKEKDDEICEIAVPDLLRGWFAIVERGEDGDASEMVCRGEDGSADTLRRGGWEAWGALLLAPSNGEAHSGGESFRDAPELTVIAAATRGRGRGRGRRSAGAREGTESPAQRRSRISNELRAEANPTALSGEADALLRRFRAASKPTRRSTIKSVHAGVANTAELRARLSSQLDALFERLPPALEKRARACAALLRAEKESVARWEKHGV